MYRKKWSIGVYFLAVVHLLILLSVNDTKAATLGHEWSFREAILSAQAIFEGTVVKVAFRDSESKEKNTPRIPHTFVTYQVDRVLRGDLRANEVTLRFMGGWSPTSGRIMIVPHGALFSPGNRDILLVENNGKALCPLVSCGMGRFRLVDDSVYDNNGRSIFLNENNDLKLGVEILPEDKLAMEFPPAPDRRLEKLKKELAEKIDLSDSERGTLKRRLADMSAPRVFSKLRRNISVVPPSTRQSQLSIDEFVDLLSAISESSKEGAGVVDSASVDKPFYIAPMNLNPSQRSGRPSHPIEELTAEQQVLRQNNGNPVVRTNR